tara:strand:- start:2591 stop:3046 length:456 start_codon:yes stop_codon:yes gene_type:complete
MSAVTKVVDQVLNPTTGFVAKMIKDVGHEGGKLIGVTQAQQRKKDYFQTGRVADYQKFDPKDIEAFAKMETELTGKTRAELEAAKPVAMSEKATLADPGAARSREAQYASMTASQRERIEGLYKGSQARLGAIERGRLRPGRKQTVLTKRM